MLESHIVGLRTPQSLMSPLPSPPPPNISTEINTATRGIHTRLNKLITSRIPLALPPHSDSPASYAQGIKTFAQIYFIFEARWKDHITQAKTVECSSHSEHHAEVQQWLAQLIPSGLWRTTAIKSDLEHMSKNLDVPLKVAASTSGLDKDLMAHILEVTTAKPHTLVAYAWIMYMAIFSGGRWIRQQLAQAGPEFWHAPESEKSQFGTPCAPVPGFSLFYFQGERDGEDIKADFKARLETAEELLSLEERNDIVQEAHTVFDMCIRLVERLDEQLATSSSLPSLDTDAAYDKARVAHSLTTTSTSSEVRAHMPTTALLAILLAFFTAWLWIGNR